MTQGAGGARPHESANGSSESVELWGGIECTVNRVGDQYFDQVALTGHDHRIVGDLERFAGLGVRTLRYPVLWERIAPDSIADANWSASDLALSTMRDLGIAPIVGLVHHGSGPRHTSLIDSEFGAKLSAFAAAVARRYPWVSMYTPINEPLTTARFATLYGLWYPHHRNDHSFARAIVNQCEAIRKSMTAVRSVNPDARLIQTEDLARTYSTPSLDYQASFDNNRRWLTFDILTGRLDEWHPLWWYLLESGITRHELQSFLTHPCVPDMLGVNHYVTSDRYLDDRVDRYPAQSRGGNGRHAYADVEAVRVLEDGIAGPAGVVREAWARYEIPLAVTEVHLGCTREEQLRWLREAWRVAKGLRQENVDIRAITVWALLGGYGWPTLLTSRFESYESGAFDLRSRPPRATALATMTRALATCGSYDHPVLGSPGWWRRSSRLTTRRAESEICRLPEPPAGNHARVILITGSEGTLGRAFNRIAEQRGLACRAAGRKELDICSKRAVADYLDHVDPWAVINTAGYVKVDDAENDAAQCYAVNTEGASLLAEECVRRGIQFATFSTDLVFDGNKRAAYLETDPASALNTYGASKVLLERRVAELPGCLVIRTSAFFGPWDQQNFLSITFEQLRRGCPVRVANDTVVSPTYVPDLVNVALDLIIDHEHGIWHLANRGALTWYEFATLAAERAGLDPTLILGKATDELSLRARRPPFSALGSERGKLMPALEDAINRWLAAVGASWLHQKELETSSSV